MSQVVSKRSFKASPAIVMHLIKSQAGTLAKAVLEAIMNAGDAGASKVDIQSSENKIVISDDGRGFQSREEIEAWFEVFGFDHSGLDRAWGAFGIGRGQLWAFASTTWRTNTFEMRVDVRVAGLDYDLIEGMEAQKGLTIEATLYEKMRTSELLTFERELKELCEYAQIPVTLNGKRISTDPAQVKWTHETDEAWIRLSDSSRQLSIYNMGVLVRSYPSYHFGVGGVVVTKKRLELNTARNDVLQSSCAVFKKIKPFLQSKADERVKRAKSLSEDQMGNLALRFLAGELEYEKVRDLRLITDMRGTRMSIHGFLAKAGQTIDKTITVIPEGERSPLAERFHRGESCFVLGAVTLGRFGVETVQELVDGIHEAIARDRIKRYGYPVGTSGHGHGLKCVENWREACQSLSDGYEEVPKQEWTPAEEACIAALEVAELTVRAAIQKAGCIDEGDGQWLKKRVLLVGVSESAEAWTNGVDRIWLNRSILGRMKSGIGGALSLVGVLVHEYLHGSPSTETHAHDVAFYERLERVMLFEGRSSDGGNSIGEAVEKAMREYAKQCAKLAVRGNKKALASLDKIEQSTQLQAA